MLIFIDRMRDVGVLLLFCQASTSTNRASNLADDANRSSSRALVSGEKMFAAANPCRMIDHRN